MVLTLDPIRGPAESEGDFPIRIAIIAEARSRAAPQGNPEWTPIAAYRSGYVAPKTAAAAPPAERPAAKTRSLCTRHCSVICRVTAAIFAGSPAPRCWSASRNQFQHFEGLAERGCAG